MNVTRRRFFATFPRHKTLCNFYGSTETMADVTFEVFCCMEDVEQRSLDDALSVGCPIWNTVIYVVDNGGQLCSQGDIGQLCVSGLNVTNRGYVVDCEHSKHFVINSFLEHGELPNCEETRNHGILYQTGDYGRVVNGRIIHEGRRDSQVFMQRLQMPSRRKHARLSMALLVYLECHTHNCPILFYGLYKPMTGLMNGQLLITHYNCCVIKQKEDRLSKYFAVKDD